MRAARNHLVVTPTGDTSEYERGDLIVARQPKADQKIYRGVVRDLGPHMEQDGLEEGCLVFYTFWEVEDFHVVPMSQFIAFEANP